MNVIYFHENVFVSPFDPVAFFSKYFYLNPREDFLTFSGGIEM